MTARQVASLQMFAAADDMPLFSGTPVTVRDPDFRPAAVGCQPSLFSAAAVATCPVCFGTGQVVVRRGKPARRCVCAAGFAARLPR